MSKEERTALIVQGQPQQVALRRLRPEDLARLKGKLKPAVLNASTKEIRLLNSLPDQVSVRLASIAEQFERPSPL